MNDTAFTMTDDMRSRRATMHQRGEDGTHPDATSSCRLTRSSTWAGTACIAPSVTI